MTTTINLQRILFLSSTLSQESYADHIGALQKTIPTRLKNLIAITEKTPLNDDIRNLVEENVISSYKELLEEVLNFNCKPDKIKAQELINWLRCEVEMGTLFIEGVYRSTLKN